VDAARKSSGLEKPDDGVFHYRYFNKERGDPMKRVLLGSAAMLLVLALVLPANAIEHKFGGYWRTRFYTNQNFSGTDEETVTSRTTYTPVASATGVTSRATTVLTDDSQDLSWVDTRTRLFYTAQINDKLKLVNKFEFDAVWGGPKAGYGDVGADGKEVEVKNSYADFLLGPVNFRVGVQDFTISRGFTFDDDAAGALALFKASDSFTLGAAWVRWNEGYSTSTDRTDKKNDEDVDGILLAPTIAIGKDIALTPSVLYVWAKDGSYFGDFDDVDVYNLAFDADLTFNPVSLWFTGIYQIGTLEGAEADVDLGGYLLALGATVDLGKLDVHGQVVYASGDDDAADTDLDALLKVPGASYYWAEIMGYGIFDEQVSAGAPADQVSNVLFANVGTTIKPTDKLSLSFDVWYAELAEENEAGDTELGTEVDVKVTYELLQGLKLDVVGAYLFAGDATYSGPDEEDPYEIGSQLSLSF